MGPACGLTLPASVHGHSGFLEVLGLSRPEQVWGQVSPVRVLIERLGGVDTVEIAYRTAWDTEHTLGARFQGWALMELNGSVI